MGEPQLKPQPEERRKFFTGFLKRPREVGSIIPSSRFMERRLVRVAEVATAPVIVELGPGTGGTSRAFLKAMRPDAQLIALEVNPDYVALLKQLPDPRFHVFEQSATQIREALKNLGDIRPDCVISGIPFSTMPREIGLQIIREVQASLKPGGWFVAYQVRDRVAQLGREVMGPCSMEFEPLNVPPMRVYRWDKPHGERNGRGPSGHTNGAINGIANGHDPDHIS